MATRRLEGPNDALRSAGVCSFEAIRAGDNFIFFPGGKKTRIKNANKIKMSFDEIETILVAVMLLADLNCKVYNQSYSFCNYVNVEFCFSFI
jgi:hypothetical protein